MKRIVLVAIVLAVGALLALAAEPKGKVIFEETFSDGKMDGWWVEGGQKVWVEDGRLHMKADPAENRAPGYVCTAWCEKEFPADVMVEYDAHVVESAIDTNNINFFLSYSHPEKGKTLYDTREERADASYKKYHSLNGYIFTFLKAFDRDKQKHADGTNKGRYRMRRCPGFKLLTETFADYCERGVTYHCKIVKKGGHIEFYVNGKKYLEADDPSPLGGGQIGLRTFRTYLWWDNIKVTAL